MQCHHNAELAFPEIIVRIHVDDTNFSFYHDPSWNFRKLCLQFFLDTPPLPSVTPLNVYYARPEISIDILNKRTRGLRIFVFLEKLTIIIVVRLYLLSAEN